MRLTALKIELERWGEKKGQYTGSAEFTGNTGSVTLTLNERHIEEIFRTCADGIIETSRAAARYMTMSVIEAKAEADAKALK